MNESRRRTLRGLLATFLAAGTPGGLPAKTVPGANPSRGNFRYVYGDAGMREAFRQFLLNVFNLYPDPEFHSLIAAASQRHASDREAYIAIQGDIASVKPFLSELRYALPALRKQKSEMQRQTVQLLPNDRRFDGYLELGSNGRYLDALEERFDIVGEKYFVSDAPPGYGATDLLDRGQLPIEGTHVSLGGYGRNLARQIPPNSIDLATVYIGFHHCPVPLREEFVGSLRDRLRHNGRMIVRDHDARDEAMHRLVALAHDVFNLGTGESWDYNARELRNFYSLDELDRLLVSCGFRSDGRRLYQTGDPTLNALMLYRKV